MADNGDVTPEERKSALQKRRETFEVEWREWYQHAEKSRGWYHCLHLEVIKFEDGWRGCFWDTVNERLVHSADVFAEQTDARADMLSAAPLYLAANFPDRSFPATEIQWIDSTDPNSTDPEYFTLQKK